MAATQTPSAEGEGGVDWARLAKERHVAPDIAKKLWERARATTPHDPKQAGEAYKHLLDEAAHANATPEPGRETLVDAKGPRDAGSLGPGKVTRVLEEQKPAGPAGSAKPTAPGAPAAAPAKSPEALRKDLVAAIQASKSAVEVLKTSDPATIVEALREIKAQEGPAILQKIMSVAGSTIERILGKHLPDQAEQPAATAMTPTTMRVTASALHVRSTPDKKGDDNIIGLLPHHTIVHATQRAGNWVGIDHGGKPAFVYAQYVEVAPPPVAESKSKPGPTHGAPHEHKDAPTANHGPAAPAAPAATPAAATPSATPAPATPTPVAAPAPVAKPTPAPTVVTPVPVVTAGPASTTSTKATPTASSGPLDALRAAVATKSSEESLAAYHKLSPSGRTQLRAEVTLVSGLVGVLDSRHALTVLDELKLDRPGTLQIAARARAADSAFLGQVLHHLHIDSIAAVTAAADDLLANPAYLPLLDHIINAKGVTGKQQLALAMSSGGIALIQKIRPGLAPLAALPALGADQAAQRAGYVADPAFGNWLFTDPAALAAEIKRGPGGADWGRLLLGGRHQLILVGWVATDQAYWGNVFGTALLKPDGNEIAALRSLRPMAGVFFNAIAQAHGVEGLIRVFVAMKFTLPEQINALGDAGRLDAKSLPLMLDGPHVGPAEQDKVAADDEAISRIRVLSAGKHASQVLTKLASDPDLFCGAVGRPGAFSKWVTEKVDVLAQEMMAVMAWTPWMKAFQALNDPMLFLSVAARPELQEPLRGALLGGGWTWLLQALPHPIPTQAQVDVLFKLYKDGTGVTLAEKYALWAALYKTPLRRRGEDVTMPWTNTSPPETGVVRWIAVDPSDTAMNLFFRQYGQMPRMHIDTASAVIMCNVYTVSKTREVENHGVKTKTTAFYQDTPTSKDNIIPAPGEIPMGTSSYGFNNTIFMNATNSAGDVRTDINADDFVGKAGAAPGAVNRSKAGLAKPDMSFFQNHATHEVGHAVAERVLKRGKYEIKGNDFVKMYGQWKDGGSGLEYARMLGFTAGLDSKSFEIQTPASASGPPRRHTYTGEEIRNFLTGIVEGGLAKQKASKIAVELGSPDVAFKKILEIADIGATVLAKTIDFNLANFPGAGWQFPHGINGETATVTMNTDGRWQQYHASIYNHRVSSYSTYSSGENFAEMYTSRYTNGTVPPAIGSNSMADFFNELTNADPAELGLAPAAPAAAPGAKA